MEPDMPDHFVHTLTTFLKCVANVHTEISKSNFDLRGLDRKCRCAAIIYHTLSNGERTMNAARIGSIMPRECFTGYCFVLFEGFLGLGTPDVK